MILLSVSRLFSSLSERRSDLIGRSVLFVFAEQSHSYDACHRNPSLATGILKIMNSLCSTAHAVRSETTLSFADVGIENQLQYYSAESIAGQKILLIHPSISTASKEKTYLVEVNAHFVTSKHCTIYKWFPPLSDLRILFSFMNSPKAHWRWSVFFRTVWISQRFPKRPITSILFFAKIVFTLTSQIASPEFSSVSSTSVSSEIRIKTADSSNKSTLFCNDRFFRPSQWIIHKRKETSTITFEKFDRISRSSRLT